ncbi:unnamed protein product, partial [marine sediment metagenome]
MILGGLTARDGKITHVGSDASVLKAELEVDAEGKYVLPGIIDTHVHLGSCFRPGEEFVPQIKEESKAAAIGGVTTFITTTTHRTTADPTVPRLDIHRKDKKGATHNSFVDFKFTHWISRA